MLALGWQREEQRWLSHSCLLSNPVDAGLSPRRGDPSSSGLKRMNCIPGYGVSASHVEPPSIINILVCADRDHVLNFITG